ncbi:uncharacterized protein LOC105699129 [Orussus abietinus]|uniref:uncharacterized protein LOC105699129 n=1 Tax=Orussus abietinus TaxID=222816 RepID=UPI00062533BB|nr:uncharacterized protein LOC105699129 [Orussus abietinus]
MEVKPVPKPRSLIPDRPIPAPRTFPVASSPSPPMSPSEPDPPGDPKPPPEAKGEFFRSLGNSSRQLKEEISEKMTVKGKAVISSTRNASMRLEKSVKNLLTRRLTSLSQEESQDSPDGKSPKCPSLEERCVSLPANDIFSGISFYSPLQSNLRSVKNEEDLTGARYSPPPPIYPPPPLPDESIYDELQSVTSGNSSRYDTLSSTMSEQDLSELSLLSFSRTRTSDSEHSVSALNSKMESLDAPFRKLSRSDSWTFYDATPKAERRMEELSTVDQEREPSLEEELEAPIEERISGVSCISHVSIQNSLYENWTPRKIPLEESKEDHQETIPKQVEPKKGLENKELASRKLSSRSVLVEFDPLARTDEAVYGNYESNDMMLLETLLATSESPSSGGSMADLREEEEEVILEEEAEQLSQGVQIKPPEPPRRYDSLPKNEYDEVELVETPEKSVAGKNPALLPKLAHLAKRKQPAVPPKKHSVKAQDVHGNKGKGDGPGNEVPDVPGIRTQEASATSAPAKENSPAQAPKVEEKRTSMMQKLKKLKQESGVHVKPNVMSFVRNSKLLSRNREPQNVETGSKGNIKLERPGVVGHCSTTHRGIVYKNGAGIERAKDLVTRAAVLSDNKLSFYTDKSMATLKEVVQLDLVHSVHLLQDVKVIDGETVHCIAVSGEGRPGIHVFYAKGITERRIWAQRILEALTSVFPVKYTAELTKAGWAYIKEGVTGAWSPAWVLLQQRILVYTRSLEQPISFEHVDLRKARCIVLREQEGPNGTCGNVPVVVVDAGGKGALHIAAPGSRECHAWTHALHQAATNCGPALNQQQLTQDNVPVILDKCINFIYAHGIMSEGIYRRSGSSSAIARLLEAFRRDAWATQITRNSYSEHDVATALRRFLRDLPDPLFPANIHDSLCRIIELANEDDRVTTYRKLLRILDPVSSATLRRILAHLHCLSQQCPRNLMTVENLSAVWGPTLMHAGENSAEEWNRSETKVVGDLIHLYPKLYQLSAADLAKEAKILEVLERHHVSNNGLRGAPSGDLKIWIYITSKDGECVNVTIGPQKTAYDVCRELGEKAKFPPHELCLEEFVLSSALQRPLHHGERVLEVVARWGYFDLEDRKDNILVLTKNRLYNDIVPLVKPPMTISGELKFADTKTKNFKSYLFEFSQAKLCCYKDKACSTKLHEWRIEDIVWFLGHEPKRNPQMGWSITFMVKNKKPTRCKDSPFFGYTLAGASKNEQYRWLAAMLFGEYQLNLRPSAVNLMDP